MRATNSTLLALLVMGILFGASCADRSWPPRDYREVRAFIYNLDGHDSAACVTNEQLNPSVVGTNGVLLSEVQVARLQKATSGSHPKHEAAGCYVPRHAYVFYDGKHRIVGWVELCFSCLVYRASSPSAAPFFDIFELEKLTRELGVPVLLKDTDYLELKKQRSK